MVHSNEFIVCAQETTLESLSVLRKRKRNLNPGFRVEEERKNSHLVFTCFWLAPLGRWKIWCGVGRGWEGYRNWFREGAAVARRRRELAIMMAMA